MRRTGVLLGREVREGDVLAVDLRDPGRVVLAAELPRNDGQLLGAMMEGVIEPVNLAPDAARELLAPPPSPRRPPRVLDLQARLAKEA